MEYDVTTKLAMFLNYNYNDQKKYSIIDRFSIGILKRISPSKDCIESWSVLPQENKDYFMLLAEEKLLLKV